ncbi:unnamed protein product [Rotaria sordida]|uniref:Uncharacterized protein n=1 Tax=Rotaria sordida TaxID=392033 RepID=A0A815APE1_9BILA|nr:unnamed protein product [Rotaria sordida]
MSACASSSSTHVTKKKTRCGSRKISFTDDDPNYENFSLVWLDEKRDHNEIQCQLRCIINYLKLFHNIEQCIKYVLSVTSEKIFLIISDTLSKIVIPRVHDHSQLEHIYIYCHRRMTCESSIQIYAKVSGIFMDNNSLMTKLKEDYQVSSHNLCSTSVLTSEKSMNNFNLNSSSVNWYPLLIETIIRTPQSDLMKKYLLSKCELDYIDNELEQKSIEDFRQCYTATDVIAWYKRDCFIYRLLNKAFRSEDIVTLFKFRCFLADMHYQLEKLHLNYIDQLPNEQNQWTFYRGQGVSSEELNKIKINIGKLISINTYFLTTTNFQTAVTYAKNGERNPFVESIVFEIIVNRSVAKSNKPFAAISEDNDQNEILFSPSTIFQNESIEQHDTVWHVKLRLIDEKQTKEINQLKEILKRENNHASPLTLLGYFLWKIGKYDKAEHIFAILFKELRSFNHNEVSTIYNDIGLLYYDRDYYSKALDYFEKSFKYARKNQSPNIAHIGTILNNIGLIYVRKKKYETALKYYREVLQMRLEINNPKPTDLADIATSYANIGCVYADMRLFSQSLINLEKALDIRLKQLPATHPHIGQSYNYIGYVYFLQGYYKRALKAYHIALNINLASYATDHSDLLKTYNNIGAAHFGEQKYLLAIEYYEKAIEIGITSLPNDHPTFVQIFQSMACAYKSMKNHSMAVKYFRKALEIEKNRSQLNHALLFEIYTHIGTSYESMSKNFMALNHYKAGLKYGFKMKNRNYSRIHTVQSAIHRCINRAEQLTVKSTKKR